MSFFKSVYNHVLMSVPAALILIFFHYKRQVAIDYIPYYLLFVFFYGTFFQKEKIRKSFKRGDFFIAKISGIISLVASVVIGIFTFIYSVRYSPIALHENKPVKLFSFSTLDILSYPIDNYKLLVERNCTPVKAQIIDSNKFDYNIFIIDKTGSTESKNKKSEDGALLDTINNFVSDFYPNILKESQFTDKLFLYCIGRLCEKYRSKVSFFIYGGEINKRPPCFLPQKLEVYSIHDSASKIASDYIARKNYILQQKEARQKLKIPLEKSDMDSMIEYTIRKIKSFKKTEPNSRICVHFISDFYDEDSSKIRITQAFQNSIYALIPLVSKISLLELPTYEHQSCSSKHRFDSVCQVLCSPNIPCSTFLFDTAFCINLSAFNQFWTECLTDFSDTNSHVQTIDVYHPYNDAKGIPVASCVLDVSSFHDAEATTTSHKVEISGFSEKAKVTFSDKSRVKREICPNDGSQYRSDCDSITIAFPFIQSLFDKVVTLKVENIDRTKFQNCRINFIRLIPMRWIGLLIILYSICIIVLSANYLLTSIIYLTIPAIFYSKAKEENDQRQMVVKFLLRLEINKLLYIISLFLIIILNLWYCYRLLDATKNFLYIIIYLVSFGAYTLYFCFNHNYFKSAKDSYTTYLSKLLNINENQPQ